jgi:hypothetical protein
MIVSASRRSDLPAYYSAWLMGRIGAGYCLVANPFDARRITRVSLASEDVDFLVLWTRDPRPLIPSLPELEERDLRFYFQMTLTGYPPEIEPGAPALEEAIGAMREIAGRLGGRRVVWRYDPIFVASVEGAARAVDADWHRRNFERLARSLEGGPERVVFSLLDEYSSTSRALERSGFPGAVFGSAKGAPAIAPASDVAQRELFETETDGERKPALPRLPPAPYPALLAELAAIARSRGMKPVSCAEPYDLSGLGIEAGACVDRALAESLWPELEPSEGSGAPGARKDSGQRGACRCSPSVDIGSYGSCPRGCAYCYATRGRGRLLERGEADERL